MAKNATNIIIALINFEVSWIFCLKQHIFQYAVWSYMAGIFILNQGQDKIEDLTKWGCPGSSSCYQHSL